MRTGRRGLGGCRSCGRVAVGHDEKKGARAVFTVDIRDVRYLMDDIFGVYTCGRITYACEVTLETSRWSQEAGGCVTN
jgi:hypothetical protein